LEFLELVQLFLGELISSDSWPGEGLVVQLEGLDGWQWGGWVDLGQLRVDFPCVGIELLVEGSRERFHLEVKFFLGELKSWGTSWKS